MAKKRRKRGTIVDYKGDDLPDIIAIKGKGYFTKNDKEYYKKRRR